MGVRKVSTFFGRRRIFSLEVPGPVTVSDEDVLLPVVLKEGREFYEVARPRIDQGEEFSNAWVRPVRP